MVCILSDGYHDAGGMQSKKQEILMEVCYDNSKDRSEIMKKVFQVEGMMCQHCEATVKKALEGLDGEREAKVSHEAGTAVVDMDSNVTEGVIACAASAEKGIVDVEYDEQRTSDAAILQAITDTGYDVKG